MKADKKKKTQKAIRANVSKAAHENIEVIQANATIAGTVLNKEETINFMLETYEFKGMKSFKK